MNLRSALLLASCLCALPRAGAAAALGDWTPNGVRVPGTENRQARMVSDGAGGALVISAPEIANLLAPAQTVVRMHHIRADGTPDPAYPDSGRTLWSNGQEVQAALGFSDRAGGVYVLLNACGPPTPHTPCAETGVIRLLHVNAAGLTVAGWPVDGIDFPNARLVPHVDHVDVGVDSAGYATVAWSQSLGSSNVLIAQRFSPAGIAQWTPDAPYAGRNVFAASPSVSAPRLAGDGSGGWIVAAMRTVGIPPSQPTDIVANRLRGSDGMKQWGSGGALAMQHSSDVALAAAVSDGAGGAVLGGGASGATRVQRLDANGVPQWGTAGAVLGSSASNVLMLKVAASTPANGATLAYAAWLDSSGGKRLQRLAPTGAAWNAWPEGRPIDAGGEAWAMGRPVARQQGGAWIFWGAGLAAGDVHALPVDTAGVAVSGLPESGLVLCDAADAQLVTDANAEGEAITALWSDVRSTPGATYIQRYTVPVLGVGAPAPPSFAFDGVRPNPARGAWSVALRLPVTADVRVEVLDLAGRRLADRVLPQQAAGERVLALDGLGRLAPGVYRVRCTVGGRSITRTTVRLR